MKNARFWVYRSGWTKLTLRPDQIVTLYEGGPTDEGFDRTWTELYYDSEAGLIRRSYTREARDCDGRLDSYGKDVCPIDRLAASEQVVYGEHFRPTGEILMVPDWDKEWRRQRDYSAEAMGY